MTGWRPTFKFSRDGTSADPLKWSDWRDLPELIRQAWALQDDKWYTLVVKFRPRSGDGDEQLLDIDWLSVHEPTDNDDD